MKMRAILIFCFVSIGSMSYSQVAVSRAKLNGNFGFVKYGDIGATVQFDRYFTLGFYGNTITDNLRVKNTSEQSVYNVKLNKGESLTLCAGVTTQSPAKIHFTALAGISFGKYNVHDNVELVPHPSGSLQILSDPRWVNLLGVGVRGEMTFALRERAGITAGVLGHVNGKFSYFRVYIGLCIGKMGNQI